MTHTATPWRSEKNPNTQHTFNILDAAGCRLAEVMSGPCNFNRDYKGEIVGVNIETPTQGEANSAFIIRACNAHEDLVRAVDIVLYGSFLDKFGNRDDDGLCDCRSYSPPSQDRIDDWIKILREALSKATHE